MKTRKWKISLVRVAEFDARMDGGDVMELVTSFENSDLVPDADDEKSWLEVGLAPLKKAAKKAKAARAGR